MRKNYSTAGSGIKALVLVDRTLLPHPQLQPYLNVILDTIVHAMLNGSPRESLTNIRQFALPNMQTGKMCKNEG